MNTLEATVASEVDAIFAKVEKPRRHRKIHFPRVSRKPVAEEWWK